MKAEPRPAAPPRRPVPEESTPSRLELLVQRIREDRTLQIAIVVGVALAVLLPTGMALSNHLAAQSDDAAWALFSKALETLPRVPFSSDSGDAAKEAISKLEQLQPKVAGSSAEPWLLVNLGEAYFRNGQPERALEIFNTVRSRFPEHPLVNASRTMDPITRIERLISNCEVEIKWQREHAALKPEAELNETKPVEPPAESPSAEGSSPGAGAEKSDPPK